VQLKKIIISVSLLLVYSLGFAHNLIPHSHDVNEAFANHSVIGHHHHQHADEHEHHDHEHVSHGTHVDENLYDFLVCVLFEMEHEEHGCVFHQLPTTVKMVKKNQTDLVFSSNTTYNTPASLSKPTLSSVIVPGYFSPLISALSLRGPPLA